MLLKEIYERATVSPVDFIKECNATYLEKIDGIAKGIIETADDLPFILISGPSGSGKTTSATVLDKALTAAGFETHTVSLDNYFRPIEDYEMESFLNNTLDLESPDRLNAELLNEQLLAIMAGKQVELPKFDFKKNISVHSGEFIQLHKGELIILEGIHSLNPSVIEHSDDFARKLYVSVRTRIEYESGDDVRQLHPSKLRLARRIIRDMRTRNRTADTVVDIYDSVERGENLYIMPYKHRSDFDIDTFIPYEVCVYGNYLPESMPKSEEKHPWLRTLFPIFTSAPKIPCNLIPHDSLIREFIGGGIYE